MGASSCPAPAGSAAAAVLEYVRTRTAALREQEPLVRLDREDAVHQMRVAVRRLRSALRVYGRVLDRERTRDLGAELKWLAGELAPARDTEVVHARLSALLDEVAEELAADVMAVGLVPPTLRADLDAVFAGRADTARTRALGALDSSRYRALLAALDAVVADPPLGRRGLHKARRVLPEELARVQRRVARAMTTALDTSPGVARDEALHEARKAAKRLRYAREAARPALGKPRRRWKRGMTALQDLLGAHQDTVVMRATVLDLATDPRVGGFALGVVHGTEAVRARDAERELPAAWARVDRGSR
ncbi:MAG TPA: CHAD domain-containing protein [Actinomycetospora sp.]|jgi:CHAD domain-containing protein|uniref:CHAD domain-containing protein n=1 Tax=Actinomycetospora sp. TaxID=1872135 RepID=UPI002F4192FC